MLHCTISSCNASRGDPVLIVGDKIPNLILPVQLGISALHNGASTDTAHVYFA